MKLEPFAWDKAVFSLVNEWSKDWLDYLCGWPTYFGDPVILIFVTGTLMIIWDEKRTIRKIVLISSSAIIASLLANWLKLYILRPRPYLFYRDLIDKGAFQLNALFDLLVSESSFPSGHTATIFGCITAINCIYRHRFWSLYLLGAFIGFTRIYVGVHYPSDVMAGVMVGALTGYLVCTLPGRLLRLQISISQ